MLLVCAVASPCPSGQYGSDDYSCKACPEGKYKTQQTETIPDPHPCFSCLAKGEWSTEGAERCSCNAGYSGIAGGTTYGTCTVCPAGQFKSVVSDSKCQPCSLSTCDVGFYLSACVPEHDHMCTPCTNVLQQNMEYISAAPLGSMSCASSCQKGWTNGTGNQTCIPCAPGTYKADTGAGICTACPPGAFSFGGVANCSSCRTTCPSGSVFTTAATCGEGSTLDLQCSICPVNTYRDSGSVCKSCDVNAVSFAGSPSASDCKCNAGYTIIDSFDGRCVCVPCVCARKCENV